jgi:hypothetical protein
MTPATDRPLTAALHAAVERDRSPADRLYAIADAARQPLLARAGFELFDLERYSLFPPNTAPHMNAVGPYLIPVPFAPRYPFPESGYFDLWSERLGASGGFLLTSAADLRAVWEHLREIFLVADESGNEFFFRYYDPRVVRGFLPTLTATEAKQFFGPVRRIFVEADGGTELLVARPTDTGVRIDRRPLE